jgi:hypothetical protein
MARKPKPSAKDRAKAISRLLNGEDPETVARAFNVSVETLLSWREEQFAGLDEKRIVATTPEYHQCISSRKAWPDQRFAKPWLSAYCGCSSKDWSDFCNRKYVPEKYAPAFMAMLVANPDHPEVKRCHELTVEFLSRVGINHLDKSNVEAATGHIFAPPVPAPRTRRMGFDYLGGQFGALLSRAHGELDERFVRGCSAEDMPAAIDWMYIRVGQQTAPDGPRMLWPAARDYGERIIGIRLDAYAARATEWAAANQWSVVRAWRNKEPYGMSILLPVTPQAYDDVLRGKKKPYDCIGSDLEAPSTHIIVEAGAERPERLPKDKLNDLTWPILVCIAYQFAALVRGNRFKTATPLRILSFAETAKNKHRLVQSGFIPQETFLAGTKYQMMEKVLELGTTRSMFVPDLIILNALSCVAPEVPRMNSD